MGGSSSSNLERASTRGSLGAAPPPSVVGRSSSSNLEQACTSEITVHMSSELELITTERHSASSSEMSEISTEPNVRPSQALRMIRDQQASSGSQPNSPSGSHVHVVDSLRLMSASQPTTPQPPTTPQDAPTSAGEPTSASSMFRV